MTSSHDWRRTTILVLALFCTAVAVWLNFIDEKLGSEYPQFQSLSRLAPVLFLLWITLPELQRGGFRALLVIVAIVCAAAVVLGKGRAGLRVLLPALGVLLALGYLRRLTAALGGRPRP